MPYDYKKVGDKYVVYNKETGAVRGHTTKANLKKYLAALYAHEGVTKGLKGGK
jgi:hypothetical protein